MKKLAFILMALSTTANAQTAYKCIVNKSVVYQAQPCDAGEIEKINIKEESAAEKAWREAMKPDFTVGELDIKKGEIKYDSLYYYAKVSVTNNTDKVFDRILTFIGMDLSGFAVDRVNLYGTVPPHSTRDYTANEQMLDISKFNRIREWKLEGK